jgi:tetratricopeptide (TPR) repeat protein
MDCRKTFLLLVASLAGTFGCSTITSKDPPTSLCVEAANCMVGQSSNPDMPLEKKQEMHEQARKAYQLALKRSPNDPAALAGLARLYVAMENHDRAVETYGKAIVAAPNEAVLRFELGMCHAQHKEWKPAIDAFKEAQRLDPDNRKYGMTLGFTLARAGSYPESLACFKATGMTDAKAHFCLARMLHHLQQDQMCRTELELALKAEPSLPGAQEFLAELNEPAGNNPVKEASFEVDETSR